LIGIEEREGERGVEDTTRNNEIKKSGKV